MNFRTLVRLGSDIPLVQTSASNQKVGGSTLVPLISRFEYAFRNTKYHFLSCVQKRRKEISLLIKT